jgi:hypothetical protein
LTSTIYKDFKIRNTKTTNNATNKWANELNRQFSKKKYKQLINEEMFNILFVKKVQMKTTVRFYLTPVRMTTIKKTKNKCWLGCRKKWKHYTLFLGKEVSSDVDIATGVSSRN